MGVFNDLFGGLFDFNHDGKTDLFEESIAYDIYRELEDKQRNDFDDESEDDF